MPESSAKTVDEVLASNLRRLRESKDMTRRDLAEALSRVSGREFSRWRVIDLEGARSKNKGPASASWQEVLLLALALQVRVPDLVIPREETELIAAHPSETFTHRSTSFMKGVPLKLDRSEVSEVFFGLPLEYLTAPKMAAHFEKTGVALAERAIQKSHEDLRELMDEMREALTSVRAIPVSELTDPPPPPPVPTIQIPVDQIEEYPDGVDS